MIVASEVTEPVKRRTYVLYFVRCVCGKESEPRGSKPMALTLAAVDGFVHLGGDEHHCRDCSRKEAA